MRKRTIVSLSMIGLAVCALGAVAAPSLVQSMEAARPLRVFLQGQFGRLMTLRSELNVTDEQRESIRKIVESHRSEIAAVAKPIVEKRRALRDATLSKESNEQAIRAAANEMGKSIGDAAVLASKIKGEVAGVLTSEQIEKIESHRGEADAAVDKFLQKVVNQ
ncbi:MAG: Spy/CpxP family protein refolding chaperone [Pirellulales bacterium]|nr:Spy/CpxP family protein refolding chaperone [Pirellulales bacterium]